MKKIVLASLICIFANTATAQTQSIASQIQTYREARDYLSAFNLMKKHAVVLSPELKAQTTADYAVFLLKAASAENTKDAKPLLVKAVSLQEDILNDYTKNWDASKKTRYLADTIVAYTANAQYYNAIELSDQFNGQEIPSYAMESLFTAYSQTRQYQRAFEVLNVLKDNNPNNFGLFKQKVLLLCDMQLYAKAQAVVLAMEPTLNAKSDEYRQIQHLKVLTHLYANSYSKAQELLDEVLKIYPKDLDLHIAQANLYEWTGQSLKAAKEYSWISAVHPDSSFAKQKNLALLAAKGKSVDTSEETEASTADNIEDLKQSSIGFGVKQENANQPNFSSKETKYDLWGRTYALGGVLNYSLSNTNSTAVSHTHQAGQADYTRYVSDKFALTGGLAAQSGQSAGLYAIASYTILDSLKITAKLDKNTTDLPLKAANKGTTADKVNLKLGGNFNYGAQYEISASQTNFSDTNKRTEISAYLKSQVISTEAHNFKVGLSSFYTKNTHDASFDGFYFNPEKMFSYELNGTYFTHAGVAFNQNIYHQVDISIGQAKQKNYENILTYGLSYYIAAKPTQDVEVGLRLGVSSRPYDGVSEKNVSIAGSMSYKF